MNKKPLYGLLLNGHGQGKEVEISLSAPLPAPEEGLLWVHIDYSHPAARTWLQNCNRFEPFIVESLLEEMSRPRAMRLQSELILELRGVNLNPGADPEDMVAIRLWADQRIIISSNRRPMIAINKIKASLLTGTGPRTGGEFITTLVDNIEESMTQVIEQLEESFEQLEDDLLDNEQSGLHPELSRLRRLANRLRRYLGPQKDAIELLIHEPPPWIKRRDRLHLKDHLHRLNRLFEELDSIRDRAIIAQEEFINRLSEQINTRMYTLSLVATLFMPLAFLTGLLGINVGGIPGADNRYGFWVVLFLIGAIAAGQWWYLRRNKWF